MRREELTLKIKTAGEGKQCFWEIKKRTPSPAKINR